MLLSRAEVAIDTRVSMMINGQIAVDSETGAYVTYSSGRSKYGLAPKYRLHIPIPEAQRTADKYGYVASAKVHQFRAWSDAEAVQHAREYLAKYQKQEVYA